jgi:hypothetical protein
MYRNFENLQKLDQFSWIFLGRLALELVVFLVIHRIGGVHRVLGPYVESKLFLLLGQTQFLLPRYLQSVLLFYYDGHFPNLSHLIALLSRLVTKFFATIIGSNLHPNLQVFLVVHYKNLHVLDYQLDDN